MADQALNDGTPTNGANPWIDALVNGGRWVDGDGGTVTITYSISAGNDGFLGGVGEPWLAFEQAALRAALAKWETVANVDFVETAGIADIAYWNISAALMGSFSGSSSNLGYHELPGFTAEEPLYGVFNYQASGWTETGLKPGGYGFVTLLHEIGHGLGLAHPHDGGTAAGGNNFPGVTAAFGDFGDFNLNQGIFTTMSYNSGWESQRPSPSQDYGYELTPMALDVAAIQRIYGANTSYRTGNDFYNMPVANQSGTGWACIWDAGGSDAIVAGATNASCTIDLRAAPLTGPNAGGYVSSVVGIYGGFTIAAGAIVETAYGNNGADRLIGNQFANTLYGGANNDVLSAFQGNDFLFGEAGNDVLYASVGNDRVDGGLGNDFLRGEAGNDTLIGGVGRDVFDFTTALGAGNIDLIAGYSAVDDTIRLENTGVFGALATGFLNAAAFVIGAVALDATDRIVFNPGNGALIYDADGTGATAAVRFANITGLVGTLTAADFLVI